MFITNSSEDGSLIGIVNSVNLTFTTRKTLYETIYIEVDGAIYTGEVTYDGNNFTLADAPTASISIRYFTTAASLLVSKSASINELRETIMSVDEIKAYTGLTVPDSKINLLNISMTALMASFLGIKRFGLYNIDEPVENEEVYLTDGDYFRLRSFPVYIDTIRLFDYENYDIEITNYSLRPDPYDFRKFFFLTEDGMQNNLLRDRVYATYNSGFIVRGLLQVADIASLDGKTLTVESLGVRTVYTFVDTGTPTATEILIGESANATATAIATKLDGLVKDDVVTLPFGMVAETDDEDELVIVNSDVPEDLKMSVAYLVAGAVSGQLSIEGVQSYSLGGKSVTFRGNAEGSFVKNTLELYGARFSRINIFSK